jgi:hypothetical protein
MVYGVQDAFEIDFDHVPIRYEVFVDDLHRVGCTPPWAKAVRGVWEVGFKARLDHDLPRLLHPPLPDGRNPQRALPSVRLGDIDPPHRRRPVVPSP